jgi:uncharacterized protein (DUF58 family)
MDAEHRLSMDAEHLAYHLPPLILAAQRLASAMPGGRHGLRRAGRGTDFWQYRPAQAGDAIDTVDWRQSARGDDLLVREREWTRPRHVWLWRDGSASMAWRSDDRLPHKADRALLLLLAVAEMARRGGETVLAGQPAVPVGTLWQAAHRLDGAGSLPLGGLVPTAGAVLLISDFLLPMEDLQACLRHLAAKGVRGHLVHVLDPAEQIFPFSGRVRFEGCEGEESVLSRKADQWQSHYARRFADHCQHVADLARSLGWSHLLHRTDQPPQTALLALHRQMGEGSSA